VPHVCRLLFLKGQRNNLVLFSVCTLKFIWRTVITCHLYWLLILITVFRKIKLIALVLTKFILSFIAISQIGILVFWDATLCLWGSASRSIEGTWRLHIQGSVGLDNDPCHLILCLSVWNLTFKFHVLSNSLDIYSKRNFSHNFHVASLSRSK
jgi:hypothetical protein